MRGLRHEADDEAHGGAQGYSVRQQEEEGGRLFRLDFLGALSGPAEGKAGVMPGVLLAVGGRISPNLLQ